MLERNEKARLTFPKSPRLSQWRSMPRPTSSNEAVASVPLCTRQEVESQHCFCLTWSACLVGTNTNHFPTVTAPCRFVICRTSLHAAWEAPLWMQPAFLSVACTRRSRNSAMQGRKGIHGGGRICTSHDPLDNLGALLDASLPCLVAFVCASPGRSLNLQL